MKSTMPLEDFFTLAEMKDGLATQSRVEELVRVMKENEGIIKNAGDAARQWSTVSNVLLATENKDCLDHFVNLDGLPFLAQWLQESQKCTAGTGNKLLEESIIALLNALKKLPLGIEQSIASGLDVTVMHLLGHESAEIQEKARTLLCSWNHVRDETQDFDCGKHCPNYDPKSSTTAKCVPCGCPNSAALDKSYSKDSVQRQVREPADSETQYSNATQKNDDSQLAAVDDGTVYTSDHGILPLSQADADCSPLYTKSSDSKVCSPFLADVDAKLSGATELKDINIVTDEKTSINMTEGCPSDTSEKERSVTTSASELESANNILECKPKKAGTDCSVLTCSGHEPGREDECHAGPMQGHSSDVSGSSMENCTENSLHGVKTFETVDGADVACESNSEASEGMHADILHDIPNPMLDGKDSSEMKRASDMDLDYGMDDALEVARQVAIEVEREVVDYRGPFCGSPDKNSECEVMPSDSPKKLEFEQHEPKGENSIGLDVELPDEKHVSSESSSPNASESRKLNMKLETQKVAIESPSSTSVAQVMVDNEKGKCDFDLNEEVCTDEAECMAPQVVFQPSTLSTPIPTIASSRGSPALRCAPLDFEGELKWKGSASTSAFHRAPTRRTLEHGDKMSSIYASSNGSKQKQSSCKIDLNASVDEIDAAVDLDYTKNVPISGGLHSSESSVEVSSRKAEKLNLDLNRLCDSGSDFVFPPSDWRVDGQFHHHNGQNSQSTASSSSSRRPPAIDFDLNDNPLVVEMLGSHDHCHKYGKSSSQEAGDYRTFKLDNDALPITSSRMSANSEEFNSQHHPFLADGQSASFSQNLARFGDAASRESSLVYAQPPAAAFVYNDLPVGWPNSFLPHMQRQTSFSPYMVDSSGATVGPQLLSMAMPGPASSFSRQPFFVGGPSGVPGFSSPFEVPASGLDLNSGCITVVGENKEVGKLRQLLLHGGSPMNEQSSSLQQPAGMGLPLKRKEPDGGWEMNMASYQQKASWR